MVSPKMSGSGSNGRYGADVATPISTDPFASADYELLWPRELFARELGILRQRSKADERITFLLSEAFVGETPVEDFEAASTRAAADDPWGSPDLSGGQGRSELSRDEYLDLLIEHLPLLRDHHEPNRTGRHARVEPPTSRPERSPSSASPV